MNSRRSCLIQIEGNSLLVANTGNPFGRLDVVSVCASHLGTKQDYKPVDPDPSTPSAELIKKIRSIAIETYKNDPNRLSEDSSGEKETKLDYEGRAIWELLQNADDAMAPEGTASSDLIGVKGLGFKSVLEITDEPEIFSGDFKFSFSAQKTQDLLKQAIKELKEKEIPPLTFRIPHQASPCSVVHKLCEDYDTVMRLPFRKEQKEIVQKKLEGLNPKCMIFFQYIEELKIILPDKELRTFSCNREKPGELTDCDIQIVEDCNRATINHSFRVWAKTWDAKLGENEIAGKRHSVSVCLPLKERKPVFFDETHLLYVFLPTSEKLPFHALIHGSFELDQSRKHIRNIEKHPEHKTAFTRLISRIIDCIPASTALRAFVPDRVPEQDSPALFLWGLIKEIMLEKSFIPCIGGAKVIPESARLWEHNLDKVVDSTLEKVKKLNLVERELILDGKCKRALELFEAKDVEGKQYPLILRNCRHGNLDDCQKLLEALYEVVARYTPQASENRKDFLNNCYRIPCWWTKKETARSLVADIPFLFEPTKEALPNWLSVDILHPEFFSSMKGFIENEEPNSHWDGLLKGKLLEGKDEDLLNDVLAPTLQEKKAGKNGGKNTAGKLWGSILTGVNLALLGRLNQYIGIMKSKAGLPGRFTCQLTKAGFLPRIVTPEKLGAAL